MRIFSSVLLWLLFSTTLHAQEILQDVRNDASNPFEISYITAKNSVRVDLPDRQPFFSLLVDSMFYASASNLNYRADTLFFTLADSILGWAVQDKSFTAGVKFSVRFINRGRGVHSIENLVPLGEARNKVYITAAGTKEWPHYLCRSRLYRPGYGPVGVVLPDNAWHLGFADLPVNDTLSLTALARRTGRNPELTETDRWKVRLSPGGWVDYSVWFSCHKGAWQNGLKKVFQEHWLYDLTEFDNSMFRRSDLVWMRNRYIMLLQFAWDKKYYDYESQQHTFYKNLFEFDSLTGGYDIFTLWPTWPRLGLDQRNQWDMYRDLPGGLAELRRQADFTHRAGKKYFISYNPWDEGTRKEDQLSGMEALLRATDADGVVLDTRGASSRELQATADKVKPGIIMYSEGMAVPKDMPGIVSGRVHDALVMPPPLNLNKLIKPDFAIFRVLQLADDRLHRELAISFFNGYGVEINTMRPGRPGWIKDEFSFLGRTTRILRQNTTCFNNFSFDPLVPALVDSVYINGWGDQRRRLYTIYCANPKGHNGELFEFSNPAQEDGTKLSAGDYHFVDLWNHQMITPVEREGKVFIPVQTEAFDRAWLNTRREGSVGCVAVFPRLLNTELRGSRLTISNAGLNIADSIVITGESPSYRSRQYTLPASPVTVDYREFFPAPVEKIVVQLFTRGELADEVVIMPGPAAPVLISVADRTERVGRAPEGMVKIPAGEFRFYTKRDPGTLEPFIPFPDYSDTVTLKMPEFFMDRYPVTNKQFYQFIDQASYNPKDTTNYLKHWFNNKPLPGTGDQPVVYVNLDDARAYAKWAGKRLPDEIEWQYAAQGTDMRKYPWGSAMDSTRCNYNLNVPTAVNAFPKGESPFGIRDLVGNIWQMTSDVYDNGSYFFLIIRGGSYYHPNQSIWYVTGGPLPVDHPEMLLLMAPGLDRNATVGFRCVKDAQ